MAYNEIKLNATDYVNSVTFGALNTSITTATTAPNTFTATTFVPLEKLAELEAELAAARQELDYLKNENIRRWEAERDHR